jgi:hypothetical protein
MKNKLIVMGLTFVILIALTPLIFGKLMNSKYNQMLNSLREKGIKIKVVADKSSYLKTDKILDVVIPSKILNSDGIVENLKLKVETKFNNLPVTNVLFLGKVEKVTLSQGFKAYEPEVDTFVKKYISFVVTTPNFKNYAYSIRDININDKVQIGVENIKGTFAFGDIIKNNINIADIYIKDKKGLIEIKNFKNSFEQNKNGSYSKSTFNVTTEFKPFKLQIDNVCSTLKTVISKKVDVISTLGFASLKSPNIADVDKFKISAEIKDVDKKILEKISKAKNKNEREKYIDEAFEKGFAININSSVKNIDAMKQKLGYYDLSLNIKFLPVKNIQQKINSDDLKFIQAKMHFITTPRIATILMNIYPKSAFLFALAKKKNGNIELNLELKDGKLYSEGQPVQ